LLHPELITGTGTSKENKRDKAINARSSVTFFNSISSISDFSNPDSLIKIQTRGEGTVGAEFAHQFVLFINNQLDKLPSPEFMLTKKWDDVKSEIRSVVGVSGGKKAYRADIAAVLSLRIINYSLHYADRNPVDKKLVDRLTELSTSDIFTKDLEYSMVREIFNGNKQKFRQFTLAKETANMLIS